MCNFPSFQDRPAWFGGILRTQLSLVLVGIVSAIMHEDMRISR